MKYCTNCGSQMPDDSNFCPNCGAHSAPAQTVYIPAPAPQTETSLQTVAKVFMVIGCVLSAFYFLIPLCWTIPMTVSYFNKVKTRQPISTGFRVCSLLFVSMIAGILMLCDKDQL